MSWNPFRRTPPAPVACEPPPRRPQPSPEALREYEELHEVWRPKIEKVAQETAYLLQENNFTARIGAIYRREGRAS